MLLCGKACGPFGVTKDMNLRMKAKAIGLMAEDYTTDHVPDMVLGHLVVSQVQCRVAVLLQAVDQLERFLAIDHLDADKNVRLAGGVVAVVEFGDVAVADQRQELLVGTGLLGQRDGEDGLAALAELGALGNEAYRFMPSVRPL